MKSFLRIILLQFCLGISLLSFAGDEAFEATFKKIEAYYEKGDYKLGVRSAGILINTLQTSNTSNS